MQLYPPIYQTSLGTPRDLGSLLSMESQGFGQNIAYYQGLLGTNGHAGLDWPCPTNTKIYAAHDGTAYNVSLDVQKGEGVVIRGQDGYTFYWHMIQPLVQMGQSVKRGDLIGLSDNTGYSTGPHLHFEYRPDGVPSTNGFFGAVDPTPFMVWAALPTTSNVMTATQVKELYKLIFSRLPDVSELAFWTAKPLDTFLQVATTDRVNFLNQPV